MGIWVKRIPTLKGAVVLKLASGGCGYEAESLFGPVFLNHRKVDHLNIPITSIAKLFDSAGQNPVVAVDEPQVVPMSLVYAEISSSGYAAVLLVKGANIFMISRQSVANARRYVRGAVIHKNYLDVRAALGKDAIGTALEITRSVVDRNNDTKEWLHFDHSLSKAFPMAVLRKSNLRENARLLLKLKASSRKRSSYSRSACLLIISKRSPSGVLLIRRSSV